MVRALLVGAGGMGKAWARNLLSAKGPVALVGWVDIVAGKVEDAIAEVDPSQSFSIVSFTDLAEALDSVKPDFVVDASVPEAHEAVTIAALERGVAVLGEKPMTVSLAGAQRMVAVAHSAKTLYMVSQSRRYDAGLLTFKKAIADLGGVGLLSADFFIGAHFGGFRDAMDEVLLMDMAIHTFDAARYLIGSQPQSVYCDSFRLPWSWYDGNESALATFTFEGGTRFSYRGSWAAEGQQTEWEATWRAVCPFGTVSWNGAGQVMVDKVVGDQGFIRPTVTNCITVDPIEHSGIAGSLQDFLHALATGSEPMGVCTDNIWSLAMVLYAVESSRLGQKVDIAI